MKIKQVIHRILQNHDLWPWLIFALISLFIIGPLLSRGYILTLDHTFTPTIHKSVGTVGSYLYIWHYFLWLLNHIIPSWLIEKIWLFLIFFLAGVGAYQLAPIKSILAKTFAGLLYIFNPFVYSRFLYGQWNLLTAYALFPFVAKIFLQFLEKPNWKDGLKAVLFLTIIAIVHLRTLTIFAVFGLVALIFHLYPLKKQYLTKLAVGIALMLIGFVALNLYWILPFFTAQSNQSLFSAGPENLGLFSTVSDPQYSLLFNVGAMYGFWGDNEGRYLLIKNFIPFWPVLFLFLLCFVFLGLGGGLAQKESRRKTLMWFCVTILAIFLSAGPALPYLDTIYNWLYNHIFLFKSFRETEKFSLLIVLGYCWLASFGLAMLLKIFAKKIILTTVIGVAALFLPIIYTPILPFAGWGQLKAIQYPQSWYQINQITAQDKSQFKMLFLPWHRYLALNFASGKIVENPAPGFFDKETIAGDNIEMGAVYTQSTSPVSKEIEENIVFSSDCNKFSQTLRDIDIKYVILAKEVDWQNYQYFSNCRLKNIFEANELILYQNLDLEEPVASLQNLDFFEIREKVIE